MFPEMSPTVGLICANASLKFLAIKILIWALGEYTDIRFVLPNTIRLPVYSRQWFPATLTFRRVQAHEANRRF